MVENKLAAIVQILDDLLGEEDILATMLKARGSPPVTPPARNLKIQDFRLWSLINASVEQSLNLIDIFSNSGIDKIHLEIANYEVIFFVIDRGTVLVVVIPALANKGLLEVELENARRDIRLILNRR